MLGLLALLAAACGGTEGDQQASDSGQATEPAADEASETEAPTTSTDESEPESAAGDSAAGDGLEDAREFYEGNTLTWVVPYDPGGGHDAYPRAFAPFLAEELGAEIVISNEPGAGAMLATNRWAAEPNPDGTTIANIPTSGVLLHLLTDSGGATFEADEIAWLGVFVDEPSTVSTAVDGPFETWDDVLESEAELRYGLTGFGSSPHFTLALLNDVFDLDMDVVSGYGSSSEMGLSLAAGDIDMLAGSLGSALKRFDAGETRPVLVFAEPENIPENAPESARSVYDYVDDPETLELLRTHASVVASARGIVASARIPEDRLAVLEQAIERALNNPEFAAAMEAQGRAVAVRNAESYRKEVETVLQAPDDYRNFLIRVTEEVGG